MLEGYVVDGMFFGADEEWLDEYLGGAMLFVSDVDYLVIGLLVLCLQSFLAPPPTPLPIS